MRFKPLLLGLTVGQQLRQRFADDAGQHVCAKVGDLGGDDRQALAQRVVTPLGVTGEAVQFSRELVGEDARMVGREEVMLEHRRRRMLHERFADRHGVAAGAALLLAGAAIIVLAADGIVRSAYAAADETRQKVLLAVLAAERRFELWPLPLLDFRMHRVPEVVVDDAQVRDGNLDPFRLVAQPIAPLAHFAVGIAAPLSATPDEPTDVERVVEDAHGLLRVAADGRGVPLSAPRAGDAIVVETLGDLDGRMPGRELGVDPANDIGLSLVDLQQSANELAACVEPDDALEAIGTATSEAASQDGGFHPADGLVDEVFQENRAQEARDRELDFVDMAFADRMQRHPVVSQLLAEPGHVLGIAGEAVECFAHDDIHPAVLNIAQQLLQPRSVAAIAGLFGIEVGRHDPSTEIVDQLHARHRLVGARCGRLHAGGMATVNGDRGQGLHQHRDYLSIFVTA